MKAKNILRAREKMDEDDQGKIVKLALALKDSSSM